MRALSIFILMAYFSGFALADSAGQLSLRDYASKGEKLRKGFKWSKEDMADPRIRAFISCNWPAFADAAFGNGATNTLAFKDISYLYLAVAAGCPEFIHELAARGMNVNEIPDSVEYTPLHAAIWSGNDVVASALLDAGARLEYRWRGLTPLHMAIQRENARIAGLLLEKGADVNARTPSLQTPLILAIEYNCPDIAKAILARNPDVNERDVNDDTALHLAARNQKVELISALIGKGADIEARDKNGRTPIMRAAYNRNLAAVKLLVDSGVNREARDNVGRTAPYYALRHGDTSILDYMQESGFNLNARRDNGKTLFHEAVIDKQHHVIDWLAKAGVDIDAKDRYEFTPTMQAVMKEDPEMLEALIRNGANVDLMSDICSPLYQATIHSNGVEMVRMLIDAGADVDLTERGGSPPIGAAVAWGNADMIDLFRAAGVDLNRPVPGTTPLIYTARYYKKWDNLKYLLEHGADPDLHNTNEWPVLLMSVWNGEAESADILLSHGANPNFITPEMGYTPLKIAAQRGHRDVIELLIRHGARPDEDDQNVTAWQWSVLAGHTNVASYLESLFPAVLLGTGEMTSAYFELDSPNATSVYVVGNFNSWEAGKNPLTRREDDGWWYTEMKLFPGKYEYRFVVDGVESTDPSHSSTSTDNYDDMISSVIHVNDRSPEDRPVRQRSDPGEYIRVDITYSNRSAQEVKLSGDFNGWSATHLFRQKVGGMWETHIYAKPGDYGYKLIVDGTWVLDPGNKESILVDGIENSRLRITK